MRFRALYAVVGILAFSLFACQKEFSYEQPGNGGNPGGGNNNIPGDFRAKIDGVQWVAADNTKGATIVAGIISVTGISSDNQTISITIAGSAAGTYFLDQSSSSVGAYLQSGSQNPFTTNANADTSLAGGTVVISEIDSVNKTISGTFYFNVFSPTDNSKKVISEGSFTKLSYVTTLPPAKSTDTLTVDIADTPWTAKSIITGISAGQLFIQGSELDASKSVILYMPQNVQAGLYPFNYFQSTYVGVYSPNPSTLLVSQGTGSLNIIQNDVNARRIKGNFNFAAYNLALTDSVQLTNGYFSVGY